MMKTQRRFAAVGIVVALCAATSFAQDDLYAKLKTYDGQQRGAVATLQKMAQSSQGNAVARGPIEAGLISVLEDPNATFSGKQEACRLLGIAGSGKAVPSLVKMMGDAKSGDAARYALEQIPDVAAGNALRAALKTTKGPVLAGVINSLGVRGEAASVSALKPFATDTDPLVSDAAIIALGKVGTGDALKALQGLPNPSLQVYRAMLVAAQKMAAGGKKGDAEKVYTSLAAEGMPAVVRDASWRGLVALKSGKASSLASAGLKSSDINAQISAASVVALLPEATKDGVAAYPALPPPVQVALLSGWASRKAIEAAPLAEQAIASPDAALRMAGIQAAAAISGARAVPALAKVAASGSPADRRLAREELADLGGPAAEQAILQLAKTGEQPVRVALITVIADRGTATGKAALRETSRDADERVATEAVKALGRVGGPDDHAVLVTLLTTTKSDMVRDAAKDAVVASARRIGQDKAAEPILASLTSASTPVRIALIGTLAEIGGDRALTEVTKATTATEPEVKGAAVTALSETWGDSRALPTLLNLAKTDTNKVYKVQAMRGYLRLLGQDEGMPANDKVTKVTEALSIAERPEEKRQALSVLRDCRTPEAVALAAKSLDDPALFEDAADAILYLAAPQRQNRRDLPAVKTPATTAALDKIIQLAKDDELKAKAQKLK